MLHVQYIYYNYNIIFILHSANETYVAVSTDAPTDGSKTSTGMRIQ